MEHPYSVPAASVPDVLTSRLPVHFHYDRILTAPEGVFVRHPYSFRTIIQGSFAFPHIIHQQMSHGLSKYPAYPGMMPGYLCPHYGCRQPIDVKHADCESAATVGYTSMTL